MSVNRRTLLIGAAALALPAAASDPAGAVLDRAATLPPAEGLRLLENIDLAGSPPARRLDVRTARAGLAIDAAPRDFQDAVSRSLGDPGAIDVARRRIDRALAELRARALPLFAAVRLARPTIGESYRALFADPRFLYPDNDAGRVEALADMRRALALSRNRVAEAIEGVPPFALDCDVRPLSPAEIAAGRQGYREPPRVGRRGLYVVDLKAVRRRPRWSLPAVVAHELLPGHMAQLGFEALDPPHPLRRAYTGAFFEGWAIYAEQLAAATGAYPDPRAELGHLHWLIFRAARARIDLGLHLDGWTPTEARRHLDAWQGFPVYFADFDTDIARIAREPGTRLAEALAWLALADRAPRSPAARRRWHRDVLAYGPKRLEDLPIAEERG